MSVRASACGRQRMWTPEACVQGMIQQIETTKHTGDVWSVYD